MISGGLSGGVIFLAFLAIFFFVMTIIAATLGGPAGIVTAGWLLMHAIPALLAEFAVLFGKDKWEKFTVCLGKVVAEAAIADSIEHVLLLLFPGSTWIYTASIFVTVAHIIFGGMCISGLLN